MDMLLFHCGRQLVVVTELQRASRRDGLGGLWQRPRLAAREIALKAA